MLRCKSSYGIHPPWLLVLIASEGLTPFSNILRHVLVKFQDDLPLEKKGVSDAEDETSTTSSQISVKSDDSSFQLVEGASLTPSEELYGVLLLHLYAAATLPTARPSWY